jgi:elongation of very long chain fatty acids protein 6
MRLQNRTRMVALIPQFPPLINCMNIAYNYVWVPWLIVIIYLVLVHYGIQFMSGRNRRKEYELKRTVMLWNMFLCLFSIFGFINTIGNAYYSFTSLAHYGLCSGYQIMEKSEPWITLFMISKIPELFDTAILIMKKRPITHLHIFHHSTVLIYSWTAYSLQSTMGLYFSTMNFFVHTIMYGYFFLNEFLVGSNIRKYGYVITYIQILQMIFGVLLTTKSWTLKNCEHPISLAAALFLYSYYLYLFVDFIRVKKL